MSDTQIALLIASSAMSAEGSGLLLPGLHLFCEPRQLPGESDRIQETDETAGEEIWGSNAAFTGITPVVGIVNIYDEVDNPIEIRDYRIPDEWPAGAKPVTRKMVYDDLYRLTRIDQQFKSGTDAWTSPFQPENDGTDTNPKHAKPSPHVAFDQRILWQAFSYDWLGNTTQTTDDAKGFYDRSLGTITNGTASAGPYQMKGASNDGGSSPGTRSGHLSAAYDSAGNLTSLAVKRSGPCLPTGAVCGQRFVYEWDEAGRLVRARRWDIADPGLATSAIPGTASAADLRYAYDGRDERVLKTAVDRAGEERHSVYVFSTLELRRAEWDEVSASYANTADTQVPYLFASGVRLARVAYEPAGTPSLDTSRLHVVLAMADHLGSVSTEIDKATSEVVERNTYQAYGGAESDYRSARWKGEREDYRFTGKEDDTEIGLQFFGARYFAPLLARWINADPLTIHSLGADINPYAYVHGGALSKIDPLGLDEATGDAETTVLGAISNALGDAEKASFSATPLGMAVYTTKGLYDIAAAASVKSAGTAVLEMMPIVGTAMGAIGNVDKAAKSFAYAKDAWDHGESEKSVAYSINGAVGAFKAGVDALATIGAAIGLGSLVAKGISKIGGGTPKATSQPVLEADPPCGCFVGGTLVWTALGPRPIETVQLGERVIASTDDVSVDETEVDADWQKINLEVRDGDGRITGTIELLRPAKTLRRWNVRPGALVDLGLANAEMSASQAWVTEINSAPKIEHGPGRVVITRYRHFTETVVRLRLHGGETIETTLHHPFYSEDLRRWVEADNLLIGEQLLGRDGPVTIESAERLRGAREVYNLEVETRHTYEVSSLGLLVHNCSGGGQGKSGTYAQLKAAGARDAHHVIQDAAVRELAGYDRSSAIATQLEGPSTKIGSPHYEATQVQRQKGGGTYGAERRIGYKSMRKGGVSAADARALIERADASFRSIGVSQETPTRIPGDRKK